MDLFGFVVVLFGNENNVYIDIPDGGSGKRFTCMFNLCINKLNLVVSKDFVIMDYNQ